jgi:hypothetical protein
MLSIRAIQERNRRAAIEAARSHASPLVLWPEDPIPATLSEAPALGDYEPLGWREIKGTYGASSWPILCDKSGRADGREALGARHVADAVQRALIAGHRAREIVGFGLGLDTPFVVYLRLFVKERPRLALFRHAVP